MGISSLRGKGTSSRQRGRHCRLWVEALEERAMLSTVAPLPSSVVLLGQTGALPPDPSIQFSPQPMVAAATSDTAVHWQGHATERLVEAPAARAPIAAWLVDMVYNLNGKPTPTPTPGATPTWSFDVSGTARETLTPLNAAGNPIAAAPTWVSNENITMHMVISPSLLATPVANSFAFTTDSTIKQTLTPLVPVAGATILPSWIASTTTHTTGRITSPLSTAGTLSFQEHINQRLTPARATSSTASWTVAAEFDAAGSFKEVPPVAAAVSRLPSGTLSLTGALTGSISPPPGMGIPTQKINRHVTANVAFGPGGA